jgi:hypothetical protein
MAHCKARESLDLIQMVSASVGAASIILILSTYWMFRKVLRYSHTHVYTRTHTNTRGLHTGPAHTHTHA